MTYQIILSPAAKRALAVIPEKAASAIIEFLYAIAENPQRLGGELKNELAGHRAAHRGGYRVVYVIGEDRIDVLRIGRRGTVYHS